MPQRILGIDVGSYSIKVAEIERDYRKFHLVGFFEQPVVFYETLGKEGSVTQAITKLLEEYNFGSDLIYTTLPGQITAHRVIDLPFADFKKVDATIEFEMENYLPLPVEELLIDYHLLKSSKTSSSVLVSYSKKSEFVKFLNLLNEANLDPRFVGSEPVELANIVGLGGLQPEGAYALLDLGHEKTNILIFKGTELQFVRTIMMGGKDLTQSVADSLNIPLVEAERMKIELGQVGPGLEGADATTRNVSEALKKPLSDLLLNLKQTFMAFQQTQSEVVQAILLCGGTSRLPGIDYYLTAELRKNVSFLDCLDFPFNQLSDSTWCRPIAASAVAMAIRGVHGSSVKDIQFRRGEFAYKGEVKELTGLTKQVAALMGVTLVCMLGSFIGSYVTLKGSAKRQMNQVTTLATSALPDASKKTLSSPSTILSTLAGKINEAEEKRKKMEDETSLSVLDVLKEFSMILPSRETLRFETDEFNLAASRVTIRGRTDSFPSLDQIKEILSKSRHFKNVATDNVKNIKKPAKDGTLTDEILFNLSFEVATSSSEGETVGQGGGNGT